MQSLQAGTPLASLPATDAAIGFTAKAAWKHIKDNAADDRERWRSIGEYLLIGRKLHTSDRLFGQWIKAEGFDDMHRNVRGDAMWLHENWSTAQALCSNASHPTAIRAIYNASLLDAATEAPKPTPTPPWTGHSTIGTAAPPAPPTPAEEPEQPPASPPTLPYEDKVFPAETTAVTLGLIANLVTNYSETPDEKMIEALTLFLKQKETERANLVKLNKLLGKLISDY